jgi:adenosylmethionine-8-amino-7-oxononanoate aminotransferase
MSITESRLAGLDLERAAREHLWMHFTRMSGYRQHELPIIARGEGCYLEDVHGRRYLDGLAGLFAVQIGYSYGDELGDAAAAQMRELPFYTNWSYAHPRAIELAAELAALAPGDLNRTFFVSGGSEAVESAWKLARQYFLLRGERRWKAISRNTAYHRTTMGALAINGVAALRTPFEALVPQVATSATPTATTGHRAKPRDSSRAFCSTSSSRRSCARGRDRGDGDHGAGPERRRRLYTAEWILRGRAGAVRPIRHPPVCR